MEQVAAGSPPGKTVHVLFLHGVGRHSRLSSLLKAYQSLHAFLRSPEAPVAAEDPFPESTLEEFNDGADPPYLRITPAPPESDTSPARAVYLYEVNYSALAGVVRENHPLDITQLFVGLDLGVNVARRRLRLDSAAAASRAASFELRRHRHLARIAQRVTTVLTAATVPVLGLPSLLLKRHVAPFVSDFTRFFEDVATFALDRNGEELIASHVLHTVERIVARAKRDPGIAPEDRDEFVIVAHSLGAIVLHALVVAQWENPAKLPDRVVTLGAPIGLVCWLWRFIDFKAMEFAVDNRQQGPYFCWRPLRPSPGAEGIHHTIEWINVLAHLDPVATAFPATDLYLGTPAGFVAGRLRGGGIRHHYIRTGGVLSAGAAHARYFDDKQRVVPILGNAMRLRDWEDPSPRTAAQHWQQALRHLRALRVGGWVAGTALVAWYMEWLQQLCGRSVPAWLFVPYVLPPVLIGYLAFWQRLFFGRPTKRTTADAIRSLPVFDRYAFPYRLRQAILRRPNPEPKRARPGIVVKVLGQLVSFVPTAFIMLAPLAAMVGWAGVAGFLGEHLLSLPWLLLLFMAYTVFFGVSEFARNWSRVLGILGADPPPPANTWRVPYRWVCHLCGLGNAAGRTHCASCGFAAVASAEDIARTRP